MNPHEPSQEQGAPGWGANQDEDDDPYKYDPAEIAITNLPEEVREGIYYLRESGSLHRGGWDYKALAELAKIPLDAQQKVMTYCKENKVFLGSANSQSGYLVAVIQKAKRGELDTRGFGQSDPYLIQLRLGATRRKQVELIDEDAYIKRYSSRGPFTIAINVLAAPEVGKPLVELEVSLTLTVFELKQLLGHLGVLMPLTKMVLKHEICGPLRNVRTLGFYNLVPMTNLVLSSKVRGGKGRLGKKLKFK